MKKDDIKIIFFGTPEFAAVILKSLIENKFDIAAVVSQSDKKAGRRRETMISPVKKLAIGNKIKIFQPASLRDRKIIRKIREIGADLFIVAAYGKILPKEILEIPKFGAVNIHASLLPKYRGASPVQCAILAGEKETGITLILMNEKMDEGDILMQKKIEIGEDETSNTLLDKLSGLGAKMTVKFISGWIGGKIKPTPQSREKATYCKPIQREDGRIDWNSAAEEIYRRWRAYQPWPGIFSALNLGNRQKRIKLSEVGIFPDIETGKKTGKIIKYNGNIAVQAGKGLVILKKIQLEGKKEVNVEDFVKGYSGFIGTSFA